jgi:hypothetical protein
MLCNRPFAGSVAVNNKPAVVPNTFNCGVVPANLGQNVPISMKEKVSIKSSRNFISG